jgi:hypothetical protein
VYYRNGTKAWTSRPHVFLRDAATDTIVTNASTQHRCTLATALPPIFRRHQAGFGTQHLKNAIRECCYPGKRMRPDATRRKPFFRRTYQREKAVSKAVSVPQTIHFLHPAADASGLFSRCWWDQISCTLFNVERKQARVLAQSCQQKRNGRAKTFAPIVVARL